jgi:hypothetical protein
MHESSTTISRLLLKVIRSFLRSQIIFFVISRTHAGKTGLAHESDGDYRDREK